MRKVALALLLLPARFAAFWRAMLYRIAYPGLTLGPGVVLKSGVRIRVTDGGTLEVGARTMIEAGVLIVVKHGAMRIGPDGFIGQGSVIGCYDRIEIGRDALIAEHVTIRDQDHRTSDAGSPYRIQEMVTAPVTLGDNVWLGAKVTVIKGVSIGDGAIIGAGGVVTRSVPAHSRAVGVPARPVQAAPDEDRSGVEQGP